MFDRIRSWYRNWRGQRSMSASAYTGDASEYENRIVEMLIRELTPDGIAFLRTMKESDLIWFHMTVGRGIRNRWLWDRQLSTPVLPDSPFHPDNWSYIIMKRVHAHVIGKYGRDPNIAFSAARLLREGNLASGKPRCG